MVAPVFISGRTNQARIKTIPLFSFLNTFKNKCKLWPKIIYNNEAVPFNMKIKPCVLMDQSGARGMRMKHSKSAASRVSIDTGNNQSDCTNSIKCLRICNTSVHSHMEIYFILCNTSWPSNREIHHILCNINVPSNREIHLIPYTL